MSSLRLRRIVRENHGGTINQCAFYRGHGTGIAPDFHPQNLLVTVGAAQVNIYDNAHCGDHLDIMSHYVVDGRGYFADAPEGPAPELLTCCWIHQPEDAVVATAGSDNLIRLISLARSEEICILEGHSGPILDIKVHPLDSNLLLSVSTDGTVRLWHLEAQKCLYTYQVMATTVAFHPNGLSFLTANAKGVIVDWEIPDEVIDMSEEQARGYATESIETGQMVTWADKLHGNHDIGTRVRWLLTHAES
ncbi:WD40-repeat-containing domain protein [Phlyctochytrium arcticum]|nr:WD40-repeat-containing domain protein [Phlyctochytrium arcticum]